MNISAINATPIKPQASFGNSDKCFFDGSKEIRTAKDALELSKSINGTLSSNRDQDGVERKSVVATMVSIAGAGLAMFALGKGLAGKLTAASPNLPKKIGDVMKKSANVVRDNAKILSEKQGRVPKFIGKHVFKLEEQARTAFKNVVSKKGPEALFKNAVGTAAVIGFAPKIMTVDGNGDGVADIAQKGINAYANGLREVAAASDLITALS